MAKSTAPRAAGKARAITANSRVPATAAGANTRKVRSRVAPLDAAASTRPPTAKKTAAKKSRAAVAKPARAKTRSTESTSTAKGTRRLASTSRASKSSTLRRRSNGASPGRGSSGAMATLPTTAAAPLLRWTETLRDGTHVLVRPITRQDAALERAFLGRLSPQSRRLRFLGQIGEPGDALVRSLVDIDWRRDAAFIALVHHEGAKREVGVSRYSLSPDGRSCECAVTVDDEWHGRGLATILMRHLVELARSRGIRTMFSIDSAGNQRMRDLARHLGFECKPDPDEPGHVIHTLALAPA